MSGEIYSEIAAAAVPNGGPTQEEFSQFLADINTRLAEEQQYAQIHRCAYEYKGRQCQKHVAGYEDLCSIHGGTFSGVTQVTNKRLQALKISSRNHNCD